MVIRPPFQEPEFMVPNKIDLSQNVSGGIIFQDRFALISALANGLENSTLQNVSFVVVDITEKNLFISGPNISNTGTLSAPVMFGSSKIVLHLHQDVGNFIVSTRNNTFSIIFRPPVFTLMKQVEMVESSNLQVIPAFAFNLSTGSAVGSNQTISFLVTLNNPSALYFSQYPSINNLDTLMFPASTSKFW